MIFNLSESNIGGGGGAEVTKTTGLTPVDAGAAGASISFSASALPCMIVVEDETRSYQISSAGAQYSVMYSYYRTQGDWYCTRAYGTRNPKYKVHDIDEGLTSDVSYSNGIVTITSLALGIGTSYTVEYAIEASGGTPVINPLSVTANGTYTAPTGVDGYSPITVNVPQGLIIPDGFKYYNGILLPDLPTKEGYPYAWIRTNDSAGVWQVVLGKGQWRTRSSATLDNWQLEYSTLTTDGAYYWSYAYDGTDTGWTDETYSTNYFGLNTTNGRKCVWTSHDIKINTSANVVMRACDPVPNS